MKITAQFTGTINTGEYENIKPLFGLEEEFEGDMESIKERQRELHNINYEMFKAVERTLTAKRVMQLKAGMRFYDFHGDQFPSVTSIIGWDSDINTTQRKVSEDELRQYGARGSIIHAIAETYAKTGEIKEPKDIPECYPDLVVLKTGSLQLSYSEINLKALFEKYPVKFLETEKAVFNAEHRYAGRPDAKFIPIVKMGNGWDKLDVKEVPTLGDYKTGSPDDEKYFKQLTAYWHSLGNEDVEQVCIFPLKGDTKQGYSTPKILTDKDKYWTLFLKDRENFQKRFGV